MQKYTAASSAMPISGVTCGRPSARTVVSQYSSACSSTCAASRHGVGPASGSLKRLSIAAVGSDFMVTSLLDSNRCTNDSVNRPDSSGAATFRTPAEAYDRHIGRYGRELARALIAAAGVQPGGRALDVGCGPGALTSELVAATGAEHVAAVDPSVPFAEACRLRLPGVRVEVAPAEALPFADAEFDHAFAQLVVNFMSDPLGGVREMRRVTRPGGTVVAAVWDYAGEMTLLRRFWDAAISLDPGAADRDEGRCMPFCTPDSLAELWRGPALPR